MDLPPDFEAKPDYDQAYSENSGGEARPECRDWKRNVCKKGDQCKYYHPPKSILEIYSKSTICHDFQNMKGCSRPNCKYLHLSKEEEDYIKVHGTPPADINESELAKMEGLPPVCNDFMQGRCGRGPRCKFRHVGEPGGPGKFSEPRERFAPYPRPEENFHRDRLEMRRRYREEMMEDEIMYLRAQVSRLKRQVADLSATNETLMDENARLRISRPRAASPMQAPKMDGAYSAVGSTLTAAFSNSPRLITADPYTVAPSRSALNDAYNPSTRPATSSLSFSAALPRY